MTMPFSYNDAVLHVLRVVLLVIIELVQTYQSW